MRASSRVLGRIAAALGGAAAAGAFACGGTDTLPAGGNGSFVTATPTTTDGGPNSKDAGTDHDAEPSPSCGSIPPGPCSCPMTACYVPDSPLNNASGCEADGGAVPDANTEGQPCRTAPLPCVDSGGGFLERYLGSVYVPSGSDVFFDGPLDGGDAMCCYSYHTCPRGRPLVVARAAVVAKLVRTRTWA